MQTEFKIDTMFKSYKILKLNILFFSTEGSGRANRMQESGPMQMFLRRACGPVLKKMEGGGNCFPKKRKF
jgi:hypothetical protein